MPWGSVSWPVVCGLFGVGWGRGGGVGDGGGEKSGGGGVMSWDGLGKDVQNAACMQC